MMREIDAGIVQFFLSVAKYIHSQREKLIKFAIIISVTYIIQGQRTELAKKKKL